MKALQLTLDFGERYTVFSELGAIGGSQHARDVERRRCDRCIDAAGGGGGRRRRVGRRLACHNCDQEHDERKAESDKRCVVRVCERRVAGMRA